jgi:hypothetical protein
MRFKWMAGTLIVLLSGLVVAPLSAQNLPRGIYAKVDIATEISSHPDMTPEEFEFYLVGLYQELLANAAVSGLALQAHWDQLNPYRPGDPRVKPSEIYDWTYLNDAFTQASLWNITHPNATPKTIQFIISPGFQSPQWLLNELPSCDTLFEKDHFLPPANCGKATFTGFLEQQDSNELPLPWDPIYKSAWQTFLVALNNQFGSNPLLVSISISGPTAATEEMIMPNDGNTTNPQVFPGHGISTPGGPIFIKPNMISPNQMWLLLFQFHYNVGGVPEPAYQNSDQAFIDEWSNAINMYGTIFNGITLVATTGNGLPNFEMSNPAPPVTPIHFTNDCAKPISMDCDAETAILSYFVGSSVGGPNAKAVQTSGVEASRAGILDLGLPGVKLVSEETEAFTNPSNSPADQILGGAQFNHSVYNDTDVEGSSSEVEQALYNVLQVIFTDTPAGYLYCEPTTSMLIPQPAPLNYVQIFSADFVNAAENVSDSVDEGSCSDGGTVSVSVQDELTKASNDLLFIAEPPEAP